MGKIRVAKLGDTGEESEQKRHAAARRQTKQSKKVKVEEEIVQAPADENVVAKPKKAAKEKKARIRGKQYVEKSSLVDKTKFYPLTDAITLVKQTSFTKFDGTVELHINLNAASLGEKKDLPAGKAGFRGSVSLPHGTGKQVRVVIADDTVLADVEAGKINFDILVAHPSMMPKLAKVARILGPKGLMPNPKTGTVTPDPEKRAKELSTGMVNFKTEPDQPLIHLTVGKVSFDDKKLMDNVEAMLDAVGRGKISKATLSATMSPGVKVML